MLIAFQMSSPHLYDVLHAVCVHVPTLLLYDVPQQGVHVLLLLLCDAFHMGGVHYAIICYERYLCTSSAFREREKYQATYSIK